MLHVCMRLTTLLTLIFSSLYQVLNDPTVFNCVIAITALATGVFTALDSVAPEYDEDWLEFMDSE